MAKTPNTPANTSAEETLNTETPATPAPRQPEGPNTYRGYYIDVSNPLEPTIHLYYVQAAKFGVAWKASRSLVDEGKPHPEVPNTKTFFADAAATIPMEIPRGDHIKIAYVDAGKDKKGTKLDAAALNALANDESKTPEQRLEALRGMMAGAK